MKDTTETGCQHNSSEAAQQNFMKHCSCEGLKGGRCAYPQEIMIQFFFLGVMPLFELRNLAEMKDTTSLLFLQ